MQYLSTASRAALLLSFALLVGCAGTADRQSAGDSESPQVPPIADDPRQASNNMGLASALQEQLARGAPWRDLQIEVDCTTEVGRRAVRIFADGVAIWTDARQFSLSDSDVREVLTVFQASDFPHMQDVYGGKGERADDDTPPSMQGKDDADPVRVLCRAELTLAGQSKRVVQLQLGEQSAELRGLADAVLDLVEGSGQGGMAAMDLDDGLAKIAAGALAPQTLTLLAYRGIEGAPAERAEAGWQLQLQGVQATTRTLSPAGYGSPVMLQLKPAELAELMRALRAARIDSLPINLYAAQYTELALEVLDKKKKIRARQFARMRPSTHGEAQRRFDAAFGFLETLHERVIEKGEPAP